MVELTPAEIAAAKERGRTESETEPRAVSVRYDRAQRAIILELRNGVTASIPARLLQGLHDATNEQIRQVEVVGDGFSLHWEELDVDLTVPGLLAGVFGTKAWMARLAGSTKSPAKARAARRNGAKGGRPRKKLVAAKKAKVEEKI